MKTLKLTLLVTFLILGQINAQEFSIIKVKGEVSYNKSGAKVKVQDKVEESTKLDFNVENDYAIGFNSELGSRYFRNKGGNSETNYLPTLAFATRGAQEHNEVTLKEYFKDSLLLTNELTFMLGANMDVDTFFIKYNYKNQAINKLLSKTDNKVIIERNELFKVDGKPIEDPYAINVSLFYLKNKKAKLVNSFKFICPNLNELSKEVLGMEQLCNEMEPAKKDDFLLQYLNAEYGRIDADIMKNWLQNYK